MPGDGVQGLGRREELPRAQVTRTALEVRGMFMALIVEMASQLNTCIKMYAVHSKNVQFTVCQQSY